MNHVENECCRYLYSILRIEGSTMWGFAIGTPVNGVPETLCTKGEYKTKLEAEIAARAFISGIRFANGEDDSHQH